MTRFPASSTAFVPRGRWVRIVPGILRLGMPLTLVTERGAYLRYSGLRTVRRALLFNPSPNCRRGLDTGPLQPASKG
jgi:hypothetical protein